MGVYLNPGSNLFKEALNGKIYVDKTTMITETNALVNTPNKYLCVSRPRRFGKSMAAAMLCAYYGAGDDNRSLFERLKLAQCPGWDQYLGKFDVIYWIMTEFVGQSASMEKVLGKIAMRILNDLHNAYPNVKYDEDDLIYSLALFSQASGRQFVFVIDEWDCIFREYPGEKDGQKAYLNWLRNLLKDKSYIAMAYMTGILPVKKYGQHSALNMFDEYSMTAPLQLAPYTGFTEEEVQDLCWRFERPFEDIKAWYDGYLVYGQGPVSEIDHSVFPKRKPAKQYHLYAPLSVVNALRNGLIKNYWNATETYEALAEYIRMDFDGLKETVARLMEGEHLPVKLGTYQNDMTSMTCRDDVLALLIHLGYLGYDQANGEVFIPNREIHDVFETSTRGSEWSSTMRALKNSQKLLEAVWAGDEETVAGLLEAAHDQTGNRTYNSEAALSYAVQLAFYKAQDEYTLFPEVDTGRGYADLIYIPKHPIHPALLVELKYRHDAVTALDQIQRQKYPSRLEHYKGNLILVGISYDHSANPSAPNYKHHSCKMLKA
ncbi:MAG: AAA family ATPase [Victivallales bacterium]|nr:AAA family ATPase [Victivallales bacterium]